ncbi:hypothetical protein C8F01DRAFT_361326 [Mycena amicta]|nr:hypothetical protein C8F01DRAFT_361326 [Mycena amicta]
MAPRPSDSTFFVFNRFPLDIGLRVFAECSPIDLARLQSTSKSIRSIIIKHPRVWKRASLNLARGQCPPLPLCPQIDATGNFSQAAYAFFIFGGGPCTLCLKPTNHLPSLFLFRFRACSSACETQLRLGAITVDWGKVHQNLIFGPWLLRFPQTEVSGEVFYALDPREVQRATQEWDNAVAVSAGLDPPYPTTAPLRTTKELDLEYAKRQRCRPLLTQNARELNQWARLYHEERRVAYQRNLAFLKAIARFECVKLSLLLKSPAFLSVFTAFNRDLEPMTFSIWIEHRAAVLVEIKMFANKNASSRPEAARSPKSLSLPPSTGCRKCPNSQRVYSKQGLLDHERDKHSKRKNVPI